MYCTCQAENPKNQVVEYGYLRAFQCRSLLMMLDAIQAVLFLYPTSHARAVSTRRTGSTQLPTLAQGTASEVIMERSQSGFSARIPFSSSVV